MKNRIALLLAICLAGVLIGALLEWNRFDGASLEAMGFTFEYDVPEYVRATPRSLETVVAKVGKKLWRVRGIKIEQKVLTMESLDVLAHFSRIRSLSFRNVSLPHAWSRTLSSWRYLEDLQLSHVTITSLEINDISALHELKSLALVACQMPSTSLRPLSELSRLTDLNLANSRLSDAQLEDIWQLRRIAQATISFDRLAQDKSTVFLKGTNIASLSVIIRGPGLVASFGDPGALRLKTLTLQNVTLASSTVESLSRLPRLEAFEMANCNFSDNALLFFTNSASLRIFCINNGNTNLIQSLRKALHGCEIL